MSEQIIGKLSDDASLSCSQLPGLAGESRYQTPNSIVKSVTDVIAARQAGRADPAREEAGEAARWGNLMENTILEEGARRLGCTVNTSITERVQHPELELQGSLDGILTPPDGDTVLEHNPERGIYIMNGADRIVLRGPGVAEAKLTGAPPADTPHLARGPMQVQGLMMCTGYSWAAIFTLYRGTELRSYVTGVDGKMQEVIAHDVRDFSRVTQTFKSEGVIDRYPAFSNEDAQNAYATMEDDLPPVQLNEEASDWALDLLAAQAAIKSTQALADALQTRLMDVLGTHKTGIARDLEGNVMAELTWGMSPARKGYAVAPKPARRSRTLRIKDLQEHGPETGGALNGA